MTRAELKLIFVECLGYWPHMPIAKEAEAAWMNMLGEFPKSRVSAAIASFASAGNEFPPIPGAVHRKILSSEPEIDRVLRQKARATELLNAGKMSQADFDFYLHDYWQPVIDQHTKAA